MDPITHIVVPGLVGGLVVAFLLVRWNRRPASRGVAGPAVQAQLSTDMINMAHIRVMGLGGLGLVAMSAIVAAYIPAVGLSLAAGFALGTVLAAILILRRKKAGPMSSSNQRPGANTVLSIDEPAPVSKDPDPGSPRAHHMAPGTARG